MAAIRCAITSSNSSRFFGFSGKKSPWRSMNPSKSGSSPRCPLLEHLVQLGQHVLHPGHVLGTDIAHRAGHLVEVALHELLAQLVGELLELLSGLGRRELVVLQLADLPGEVGRQHVELGVLLLHDLVGDLLAPRVAGLGRLAGEVVEPLRSMSTTSRSSWAMSS